MNNKTSLNKELADACAPFQSVLKRTWQYISAGGHRDASGNDCLPCPFEYFRDDFQKLNHEFIYNISKHSECCYGERNNGNRSASDMLFVTLCHLRIAFERKLCKGLHKLSLCDNFIETHLFNTMFEMRVMSCQHNIAKLDTTHNNSNSSSNSNSSINSNNNNSNSSNSSNKRWVGHACVWPSVAYVSELTGRVSQLIVLCLGRQTESIMNRLPVAYAKDPTRNLKPSIRASMLEFQIRKPESKKDQLKKQHEMEEENKNLTGDARELAINQRKQKELWGKSEAAQGKIWTNNISSILRTFISSCSYIQSKYELDLDVLKMLTTRKDSCEKTTSAPDIPLDIEHRIHTWKECIVRYKTSLRVALLRDSVYVSEQADEGFRRMLSDVVFESILPMGARYEHYRSDATRHSAQPDPVSVFTDYCGTMSQTFIHWLMTKDNAKFVLDHTNDHPMYSLFSLTLMSYLLNQLYQVDFLELYVVQASQIYTRKETHLTSIRTPSRRFRRPVLVCLMRRWYVLNKGTLIDPELLLGATSGETCTDGGLFDALVVLLAILKHEFDGKTEYGDNIQVWLDKMLLCGEASREKTHKRKQ